MTTTKGIAPPVSAPLPAEPKGITGRRSGRLPYGLLVPSLLAIGLALAYPLVRQVVLSLQDYGLAQQFGRPAEWVSLKNYTDLLGDPYLWTVVFRSLAFCLVNAVVTMVIGVGVALLLRQMSKPMRLLVQSGLLLAWAMPVIAALTVWQWLFDTQYGVVNWILVRLGADYAGHSWLISSLSFFLVATVIVVWQSVPFVAFTMYAGFTQVPQDLLEAAQVDGANAWQRFRRVMLPTVRPLLLIVMLLQIIWDLRVFTQIYVLQKAGGVTRDTNLLGTYIYRLGIGEQSFGTAAAVAMFMLALTVVLTAPYVRSMLRNEEP